MADHPPAVQLYHHPKSYWLQSPEIKKMSFRTQFWFCLPIQATVQQHLDYTLAHFPEGYSPSDPAFYPVFSFLLHKLATALDSQADSVYQYPGHYHAFFPTPDEAPSSKGGQVLARFQVRLRLFDTLLFIAWPHLRLHVESLPSTDVVVSGNVPEAAGDIYGRASWLLRKVYNSPKDLDTLIDDVVRGQGCMTRTSH